ncbi:hypothetical protein TRAPUB_836 [Trametes pubescens]|uniref:Uncharacterized protein n=1 Tax=Trametes pubescens TaxID=154538 RepID=A0A1M2VL51_TRAPU|nr:hypothetical protein TRAPUB_836 [Trametes pubescens]
MPVVSVSVDAFLVAAVIVLVSTAFIMRRQPDLLTLHNALTLVVVFHTLSIFYTIFLHWPSNIFQRLKIPLTTPSDTIRAVLLQSAGLPSDASLPKPLETLLTRLSSFDMRTLYVRFGQTVIQDCEYCTTFDEYLIFAAPRLALGYIKEAALAGLITIQGSGRERWRTYAVALLVAGFIVEGYWVATTPIGIPRDGRNVTMWHDNLWIIRHLFFLAFPILLHILPKSPPKPNPAPLMSIARAQLQKAQQQLVNTRFVHAAMERQPALRAASTEWWERQRVEGEWARSDEHVRRAAEKLGKGIQEGAEGPAGKLSQRTKDALRQIFESLGLVLPH